MMSKFKVDDRVVRKVSTHSICPVQEGCVYTVTGLSNIYRNLTLAGCGGGWSADHFELYEESTGREQVTDKKLYSLLRQAAARILASVGVTSKDIETITTLINEGKL